MSIIGIISPPQKTSPVPSNCKITQEGNKIILTDDTSTHPFIVSHDFNAVTENFTDVINNVSTNDSLRIISFGSEFSTPNITQIKEWSIQLINQRFQANPSQSIPISAGLVYDKDVLDLLSLRNGKSEKFELVDSDDIYSAMDLIEVSFEKFKRFKETVFVLHIGMEPFFEWVVVPRVDNFVPTPSLTGLPPNEKLIFILKQFPTITESGITTGFDRFRRMSNIFKLVLDTFCDIETLWVFHFATDVTFKSNNALIKIAEYITNIGSNSRQFQISRSNLFDVHSEEEEADFKGLNPELLSSYLTDQQRKAAEAEGAELEKRLNLLSSDDENYGKVRKRRVGKKKNDKGEYEYEYEYEYGPRGSKRSGRKTKKRRVRKGPDGTNEYEYYEYADGDDIDGNGKRRRRRRKNGPNEDGYEYYDEYLEEDGEYGDLDVIGELNKRRQNRSKRGKGKGKGANGEGDESTDGEGSGKDDPYKLAKKAADDEARAKKAAEKEARDQKIKELLDKRKQGKKKTDESDQGKESKKKGKKGKQASTSNYSNGSSMMSQRDKINKMMQKFRNQLAQEGSDDFDDFDMEEEDENPDDAKFLEFDTTGMTHDQILIERQRRLDILKEKKRRAALAKRREYEHELLRLQMLAVNALALARRADPNQSPAHNQTQKGTSSLDDSNELSLYTKQPPVTSTEMRTKDGEIVSELDKVEEARKKRVDELLALNKKLNDQRKRHEKYQGILKERRALFLDIHNSIVQMKMGAPPPRISDDIYGEGGGNDNDNLDSNEAGNKAAGGQKNRKRGQGNDGDGLNGSGFGNKTSGGQKNRKDGTGADGEGKFTRSAKLDRAIAQRKVYDSSKSKRRMNNPEYQQTKMLLLREIATVKKEIALIKRRQKALNHEI